MKKINLSAIALGMVIGLASGTVGAGVNEKMNEMFGSQSNITTPGVAEGSMRGVVSGGNVTIRNPIVSVSPWTFDPPRVSAGCGGIDLYGGNLSFPSKEQYIAVARAVVSNAGGYAFKTALGYVCDKCETVMSQIQDTINALNIDSMSSCQIAEGVVDGVMGKNGGDSALANAGRNLAATWKELSGDSRDQLEARNAGGKSPVADAVKDPTMADVLQGNWTWSAMNKTGAFDWLGSDIRTKEQVLSLIGTVITCMPGENGCPGDGKDMSARVLEPKLKLNDFVAPAAQASNDYPIYRCDNDECLNPSTSAKSALGTSATDLIVKKLLGNESEPGILERMVMRGDQAGTLTNAEKMLVANTRDISAVAAACMRVGEQGEGYARIIVEGLAPVVAADVLARTSDQSLVLMIAELSQRPQVVAGGQAIEMLKKARAELAAQNAEIKRSSQTTDMLSMAINRCGSSPLAIAAFGSSNQ